MLNLIVNGGKLSSDSDLIPKKGKEKKKTKWV